MEMENGHPLGVFVELDKGRIAIARDFGIVLNDDSHLTLVGRNDGFRQLHTSERVIKVAAAFAGYMGLTNTHFVNPSGLPDECHYTTAAELCTIACNAMKNDTFKKIVSTRNYTGEYRSFVNKNKMLSRMDGANGIKTGYTMSAGRCLVSSAEREGVDVVCVVLNCPDMYERSEELLEQAFSTYCLKQIGSNRVFMCDIVPCRLSKDCTLLVKKDEEITFKIIKTNNHAHINAGDEIARLEIYCQNDLIFSENLYSIVNRNNIF